MKQVSYVIVAIVACLVCTPLFAGGKVTVSSWDAIKQQQKPNNNLPSAYDAPYRQPLSTLAWEDGACITRDGLTLYTQYIPMDLFKGTVEDRKANPNLFRYKRGPSIGQDLSAPAGSGIKTDWMHSDIAYSTRASVNDAFGSWTLSNARKQLFNDAAPQGILNQQDPTKFDIFVYTDEDTDRVYYAPKIRILRNVGRELAAGSEHVLSFAISPAQYFDENPHVERYDDNDPNKLVLFFDSKNRSASLDVFFTTSTDNGKTWAMIAPVASVNTPTTEHQPHLYFDGTKWWLYLSALNPADGKLAIYRYAQGESGDWDSWINKELVISAGTSLGVGEPTLTQHGDISFVVITRNTIKPTGVDKYDADPWYMRKKD